MKRYITTICLSLIAFYSYSQLGFYLGLRGGAGAMITQNELNNFGTSEGVRNVFNSSRGWSAHGKAEALVGFWRIRLGYQFLYNFGSPSVIQTNATPTGSQFTTYFNNSQTHFFGQYFLAEIAVINARHFALVPGIALGSFTGFKVDENTGQEVKLSQDTHHRFSLGAELNAEVKFGRWTILVGPNYYFFSMTDKANSDWKEYQHYIGGDIGFRVNLIKPKG
jgi:hypothetical protein